MLDAIMRRIGAEGSTEGTSSSTHAANGTNRNDVLNGGPGEDRLNGKNGDDTLNGFGGDDDLSGGSGADVLNGGAGDDMLKGGSGNDELSGGAGNDELNGGSGDDTIDGGTGSDKIKTGSGDDTIRFSGDFRDDTITDFDPDSDVIDLTSFANVTSLSQLIFTRNGSDTIITSDEFDGSITIKNVSPAELQQSGVVDLACFLRGTSIRTPVGERAVEDLAIKDEVVTVDGLPRKIKWIGYRAFSTRFLRQSPRVLPVTVHAHAIAENEPSRDLAMSPGHSLLIDGVLVNADLLANGDSIHQRFEGDRIEYFHIELETADAIFANGTPAETYVNDENRQQFANWRDYVALYGEDRAVKRLSNGLCAHRFPHVQAGEQLAALRQRINERAGHIAGKILAA
jgi:hypothetical protein